MRALSASFNQPFTCDRATSSSRRTGGVNSFCLGSGCCGGLQRLRFLGLLPALISNTCGSAERYFDCKESFWLCSIRYIGYFQGKNTQFSSCSFMRCDKESTPKRVRCGAGLRPCNPPKLLKRKLLGDDTSAVAGGVPLVPCCQKAYNDGSTQSTVCLRLPTT